MRRIDTDDSPTEKSKPKLAFFTKLMKPSANKFSSIIHKRLLTEVISEQDNEDESPLKPKKKSAS